MLGKILAIGFICIGAAGNRPATAATPPPAKTYEFDVVSIRQNISDAPGDMGKPTPDGYRMTSSSFALVINTAYVPQTAGSAFYSPGQIKGLPGWANMDRYDIDGRISQADQPAWQNPPQQRGMLRSMLQAMLAERCKLVVHREIKDATVYALTVGKNGIKFKETDPTVALPPGEKLPWGGVLVNVMNANGGSMSFHGTSMASLASLLTNILSGMGHHEGTVQDKTGLTGRYDFAIKFSPFERRTQGDGAAPDDPSLMAFTAATQLGLKLEKSKGQVETLVIDHMERPSKN
jgi:bla regulator protein BlaR1